MTCSVDLEDGAVALEPFNSDTPTLENPLPAH